MATSPRSRYLEKARAKYAGLPVPPHLKHGNGSWAATVYRCDCRVCLPTQRRHSEDGPAPHVERQRRLKASKKGQPVPAGTKHGIYTYHVYGHRCDECVEANRIVSERHRNAWRATATGDWQDDAATTVLHWPPRGTGMWECPDCLEKFPHRPEEAS